MFSWLLFESISSICSYIYSSNFFYWLPSSKILKSSILQPRWSPIIVFWITGLLTLNFVLYDIIGSIWEYIKLELEILCSNQPTKKLSPKEYEIKKRE